MAPVQQGLKFTKKAGILSDHNNSFYQIQHIIIFYVHVHVLTPKRHARVISLANVNLQSLELLIADFTDCCILSRDYFCLCMDSCHNYNLFLQVHVVPMFTCEELINGQFYNVQCITFAKFTWFCFGINHGQHVLFKCLHVVLCMHMYVWQH
jgi:hypothetical protein